MSSAHNGNGDWLLISVLPEQLANPISSPRHIPASLLIFAVNDGHGNMGMTLLFEKLPPFGLACRLVQLST